MQSDINGIKVIRENKQADHKSGHAWREWFCQSRRDYWERLKLLEQLQATIANVLWSENVPELVRELQRCLIVWVQFLTLTHKSIKVPRAVESLGLLWHLGEDFLSECQCQYLILLFWFNFFIIRVIIWKLYLFACWLLAHQGNPNSRAETDLLLLPSPLLRF